MIKIAAVTAGSEVYEISRESGSMTLLQVWSYLPNRYSILEDLNVGLLGSKLVCIILPSLDRQEPSREQGAQLTMDFAVKEKPDHGQLSRRNTTPPLA